jgi:CRP-like cAMP-binding protein
MASTVIRLGGAPSPLTLLLNSYAALSADDAAAVEGALGEVRTHPVSTDFQLNEVHDQPMTLISGWAAETVLLEDGRRQIVRLLLPGDVIEPGEARRAGLSVTPLTAIRVGDARRLVALLNAAEGQLGRAWRRLRQAAQNRLVRHVVRLGRLSASDRTADLMLELHDRQRRAGVAAACTMHLPLTQEMLADHLGLSIVHVNRTLQQLRRDGLIYYQGGRAVINEPERLAAAAGFGR